MNPCAVLAFTAGCFFLGTGLAASVTPDVPYSCSIRIIGPIDAKTPAALEAAIRKAKAGSCGEQDARMRRALGPDIPTLALPLTRMRIWFQDSPGGDMIAAIQAGRIVRREAMKTFVPLDGTCASACVLMYLGGVERESLGRLGLHRPYSTVSSQSLAESQERTKRMVALTRVYLEDMNIPLRLLDIMNAIPSDAIRWLPERDDDVDLMGELLLVGEDPAFVDVRDSDLARIFGLTKEEYHARRSRAGAACKGVKDEFCYTKFMRGIK